MLFQTGDVKLVALAPEDAERILDVNAAMNGENEYARERDRETERERERENTEREHRERERMEYL